MLKLCSCWMWKSAALKDERKAFHQGLVSLWTSWGFSSSECCHVARYYHLACFRSWSFGDDGRLTHGRPRRERKNHMNRREKSELKSLCSSKMWATSAYSVVTRYRVVVCVWWSQRRQADKIVILLCSISDQRSTKKTEKGKKQVIKRSRRNGTQSSRWSRAWTVTSLVVVYCCRKNYSTRLQSHSKTAIIVVASYCKSSSMVARSWWWVLQQWEVHLWACYSTSQCSCSKCTCTS